MHIYIDFSYKYYFTHRFKTLGVWSTNANCTMLGQTIVCNLPAMDDQPMWPCSRLLACTYLRDFVVEGQLLPFHTFIEGKDKADVVSICLPNREGREGRLSDLGYPSCPSSHSQPRQHQKHQIHKSAPPIKPCSDHNHTQPLAKVYCVLTSALDSPTGRHNCHHLTNIETKTSREKVICPWFSRTLPA